MRSSFDKLRSEKARLVIAPPRFFDFNKLLDQNKEPRGFLSLVQGLSHSQELQQGTSVVDVRNRSTYHITTHDNPICIHMLPSLGLLPPQKEGFFTNYLPSSIRHAEHKKSTQLRVPDVFFCSIGSQDALFNASVHCLNVLTS